MSDDSFPKVPRVAVGLNSNVQAGDRLLHVQTEDLGRGRCAIVTHVFSSTGQVVRVVRFDYSKHVDHPGLCSVLRRAMLAQHEATIRRLLQGSVF